MDSPSFVAVGSASDNIGLAKVEWKLDDSPVWLPATGTSTWAANIESLAPGVHTLEFRALDASGNYSVDKPKGLNHAFTSSITIQTLPAPYDFSINRLLVTASTSKLVLGEPVRLIVQSENQAGVPLMGSIITIITSSPTKVFHGLTDRNGLFCWDYIPDTSTALAFSAYTRGLKTTYDPGAVNPSLSLETPTTCLAMNTATLTAVLKDGLGLPMAGKTVSFQVLSGHTQAFLPAVTTDGFGVATATYTAQTSGQDVLIASSEAIQSSTGTIPII
jgi:hypothetical protein